MKLFTRTFWASIAWILVRTALAGVVPFVPALFAGTPGIWAKAGSTVGLLLVAAVANNLRSTADAAGPWWSVLLLKGVRQFGQMVAAGLGTAVLLSDVDWPALLATAAAAAVSTIVLNALTMIPTDLQPAPVVNGVAQIATLPDNHRDALTELRAALVDGAADSGHAEDPAVAALDHVLARS